MFGALVLREGTARTSPNPGEIMDTRTIAVIAFIVAIVVLLLILL